MDSHCDQCESKCCKAVVPTVLGWRFYKALLLVFIIPLAIFIIVLSFASPRYGELVGFLLACLAGAIAFIPAVIVDRRNRTL